jgi:hypothetical protein
MQDVTDVNILQMWTLLMGHAVFSTAFKSRGADLPFFYAGKILLLKKKFRENLFTFFGVKNDLLLKFDGL